MSIKCDVCGMDIPNGKEVSKNGKTLCSMCAEDTLTRPQVHSEIGFLVFAPDRGFVGNEEVREAFSGLAEQYTGELVFVTEEEAERHFRNGINKLESRNVKGIWALPLFLSPSNGRYLKAVNILREYRGKVPIRIIETMSRSYLTEEILYERVSKLSTTPREETLVVVGSGAIDREGEKGIKDDLQSLAERIERRLRLKGSEVVVLYSQEADEELIDDAMTRAVERIALNKRKAKRALVVPFNFGFKHTHMMSLWSDLKLRISQKKGILFAPRLQEEVTPHPNVTLWLKKKANERLPISKEEIGIVFQAHGQDYNWHETMRNAIKPLSEKYKIEIAFGMASSMLIHHAVHRLESRGCRAIVLLRVFGLEYAFREKTKYMLGLLDHTNMPVMMRISSSSVFVTLGGLEDHPLFAEALLTRAQDLSVKPEKETVILLGHGYGREDINQHFLDVLESLAEQMRAKGGSKFRDIQFHTWREDWPDKREKSIEVIRKMVKDASLDGGAAIVIPARTTGKGHPELLKGLEFRYGTGFAPHPNFPKWVDEKIQDGIDLLQQKIQKQDPLFTKMK